MTVVCCEIICVEEIFVKGKFEDIGEEDVEEEEFIFEEEIISFFIVVIDVSCVQLLEALLSDVDILNGFLILTDILSPVKPSCANSIAIFKIYFKDFILKSP